MKNKRPRILVVDEAFATVRDSGKRIRTGNLLESCSRDYSITYVAFATDGSDAAKTWQPFGIETIPVEPPVVRKTGIGQLWTGARVLLRNEPASIVAWRTDKMTGTIEQLIRERDFDLIHCEITQMSWAIPFDVGVPTVLDAHNVETIIWERLAQSAKPPLRWVFRDQARKMERFEKETLSRFSQVLAVSKLDAERLSSRFGINDSLVIPNGASLGPQLAETMEGPPLLLYPGALDWRPAQEGAVFLLREIFPKIRKCLPDARLSIVGKDPPPWLVAQCSEMPGVSCHPNVTSMDPYYSAAHLVVVPLRVGSGSRIKILEAFSYGRPVVSTTIGAEGLEVRNGIHLSIADDAEAFAREVFLLLENQGKYASYVQESRKLVSQLYAWPEIGKKLSRVWDRVINSNGKPPPLAA